MSKEKEITVGSICWLHFNTEKGQSQSGDYAYVRGYAPNVSRKVEDGETYVKVIIKQILFIYGKVRFQYEHLNKNGSMSYSCTVDGAKRLTPFDWTYPEDVKWANPPRIFQSKKISK